MFLLILLLDNLSFCCKVEVLLVKNNNSLLLEYLEKAQMHTLQGHTSNCPKLCNFGSHAISYTRSTILINLIKFLILCYFPEFLHFNSASQGLITSWKQHCNNHFSSCFCPVGNLGEFACYVEVDFNALFDTLDKG